VMSSRWKTIMLVLSYVLAIFFFSVLIQRICRGHCIYPPSEALILGVDDYFDGQLPSVWSKLLHRIRVQPFNLVAFFLFASAICHTFCCRFFLRLSHQLREKNVAKGKPIPDSFWVGILQFMGEVEVVFGFWVIPLFFSMAYFYGWEGAVQYLNNREYIEPTFVVIIMALASSRPIVVLAEDCLKWIAKLGGESVQAWWCVLLT